jgi:hypothetical protein
MSPLLPVKKIYVDSTFRTDDSVSASNFKFPLPFSITLPKECIFLIDDVCVPHAWYSIEQSYNDQLYIYLSYSAPATGTPVSAVLTLIPGNYSGPTFATMLEAVLNGRFTNTFTATYNVNTNNVRIGVKSTVPVGANFQILTDKDLTTKLNGLFTAAFDKNNFASVNDVLGNFGFSSTYGVNNSYTSGFLNMSAINNLYLSSPNLGTFTTLSPTGSMNVIKKIPVSADWGYMIIDRVTSQHDYLECGGQNLRMLEFNLRDSKGNYVPMHGENISFSIVFSVQTEDR